MTTADPAPAWSRPPTPPPSPFARPLLIAPRRCNRTAATVLRRWRDDCGPTGRIVAPRAWFDATEEAGSKPIRGAVLATRDDRGHEVALVVYGDASALVGATPSGSTTPDAFAVLPVVLSIPERPELRDGGPATRLRASVRGRRRPDIILEVGHASGRIPLGAEDPTHGPVSAKLLLTVRHSLLDEARAWARMIDEAPLPATVPRGTPIAGRATAGLLGLLDRPEDEEVAYAVPPALPQRGYDDEEEARYRAFLREVGIWMTDRARDEGFVADRIALEVVCAMPVQGRLGPPRLHARVQPRPGWCQAASRALDARLERILLRIASSPEAPVPKERLFGHEPTHGSRTRPCSMMVTTRGDAASMSAHQRMRLRMRLDRFWEA